MLFFSYKALAFRIFTATKFEIGKEILTTQQNFKWNRALQKELCFYMANELDFNDMKFKTYMNFALNERFSFSFQA